MPDEKCKRIAYWKPVIARDEVRRALHSYAERYGKLPGCEPNDLVGDVWAMAYDGKISTPTVNSDLVQLTFLFKVLNRLAIRKYLKAQRERSNALEERTQLNGLRTECENDPSEDVSLREAMSMCLEKLDKRRAKILIEQYCNGRTLKQIASRLNSTVPTIHRHSRAAREQMRACLKSKGF